MFLEDTPTPPPTWTNESFVINNGITTAIVLVGLWLMRYLVVRWLRNPNHKWSAELRRRWIANFKIIHLVVTLFALTYIWSEQVYAFAVSIFAIALAVVLAVKELLLCLNGSLLRLRGHAYDVGDRIEINGIRGDVIDVNLLSTTVMEVGPGDLTQQQTGRSISLPNSLLLTHPVVNESFLQNFLLHNITIPLNRNEDWRRAKKLLLEIAQDECSPFLEQARARVLEIERKQLMDFPSVEPRISMHLLDLEQLNMILRIPTPAHQKGRIERNIIDRFMEEFTSTHVAKLALSRPASP